MTTTDEALIRAIVRQELRSLLAPLSDGDAPQTEWVDANEASEELGFPNKAALYSAITAGLFRMGKEVRDRRLPGRKKPRYQFHLENCRKRLETDPNKRKAV